MIELSELRDSAQKAFPADALSPSRDESWQLVAEMGWLMTDLSEDLGGLGLGRGATTTLHFEMGRVLSSAPLIPALLGLQAIARAERFAERESWIERMCAGEYVPLPLLSSDITRDGGKLDGRIGGVFEADMATHVIAALPDLYALVPLDAPGVTVSERPLWDPSRRIFDVLLDSHALDPALVLAEGAAAEALHDHLTGLTQLAIAADCLGGADAALAMTVEYLKTRQQFNRPLAMFQALKQRCADLKTQITAADALLWVCAADAETPTVEMGALKALAADVFAFVAEEMIQLHGGIGLTEEHPCHLFMKRAMLNTQLAGSADKWSAARGRALLENLAG